MTAVDTSSLRRFLAGETGRDVDLVRTAMAEGRASVPPAVVCEVLSDPGLPRDLIDDIARLPVLEVHDGFWFRAGILRASLIREGGKANVADTLIAQSCIDHRIPLITHDRDFRHFSSHGLTLA